ncbi:MAG: hypothetical protein ABOK23_00650 [Candidatus Methanoperedens sp.]|nr:hypothetical protein [Candidatus Methanoperedens sp.]MCZ7395864.1 hypothetical protein [Candidatus Methanoperedens sp.]
MKKSMLKGVYSNRLTIHMLKGRQVKNIVQQNAITNFKCSWI